MVITIIMAHGSPLLNCQMAHVSKLPPCLYIIYFQNCSVFFPFNAQSYVSVLRASSHLSVTHHYLSSLDFSIYNIFDFLLPGSYIIIILSCMLPLSSHLSLPHCSLLYSLVLYCPHLLCSFCCSSLTAKGFPALYPQFICLHRDTASL